MLYGIWTIWIVTLYAKMPYTPEDVRWWVILLEPVFIASLGLYTITSSMVSLFTVGKLFNYHYRQTWRNLLFSDQAILIADESYYNNLIEEITTSHTIAFFTPSKKLQFERYLELCSYVIRALRASAHGCKTSVVQGRFKVDWQCYSTSWMFKPGKQLFLIFFSACVLTAGIIVPISVVLIAAQGPRFIASRAVLVAFLDFILEQPPAWVDKLTPPSDIKRPWWWRSVAPLLRDAG